MAYEKSNGDSKDVEKVARESVTASSDKSMGPVAESTSAGRLATLSSLSNSVSSNSTRFSLLDCLLLADCFLNGNKTRIAMGQENYPMEVSRPFTFQWIHLFDE
jgi:hypothetical protein